MLNHSAQLQIQTSCNAGTATKSPGGLAGEVKGSAVRSYVPSWSREDPIFLAVIWCHHSPLWHHCHWTLPTSMRSNTSAVSTTSHKNGVCRVCHSFHPNSKPWEEVSDRQNLRICAMPACKGAGKLSLIFSLLGGKWVEAFSNNRKQVQRFSSKREKITVSR